MKLKIHIKTVLLLLLLSSCGAYFNQPVTVQKATYGETTPATLALKNLPNPKEKVVVGVYKFKDQTGQYKAVENGSTFSTAVTQGATSILINALEDSKWFIPIERENLGNLLNERNIIRSTRQEYSGNNGKDPQITPLLFAGVLLEGGIVSYDTNIITGGFGARYFGAGGSTQYREDRVTIYLRLVSTSNGKILNTVYVSKTILSQSVSADLFRYVNLNRLLEAETGFTRNEPVHLAVTEAIEKAVEGLVVDGIKDGIWQSDDPDVKVKEFVKEYDKEREEADLALLYGRNLSEKRGRFAFDLAGGATLMQGDYSNPVTKPFGKAGMRFFFTPNFNLNGSVNAVKLGNKDLLDVGYATGDLNLELIVLPYDHFTPFVYAGTGVGFNKEFENFHSKFQYGAGLEYLVTDQLGFRAFAEYNLNFTDNLDYLVRGKRDDYYWKFGVGLTYYIPSKIKLKRK